MYRTKKIILTLVAVVFYFINLPAQMKYPFTKKVIQTDDYFGTKVEDPYRWLEDDKSAETKEWVIEQNLVTQSYLSAISYRKSFQQAIEKVYNYPKYTAPFRNGSYYFFYKNNRLQNQSVLYRQKGLNGKIEEVIDPNKLSADGTTRLQLFALSKKGEYAVIGLSKGGSDWQTYYVRDMNTGKNLPDELNWVKVSGAAWKGNGFYYSRYPSPKAGSSDLSAKNENHQVYFHKVGTLQNEDLLIYENKENQQRFNTASTSEDEQFLFLNISDRGKGLDGNAIYYKELKENGDTSFKPLVRDITNNVYNVINNTSTSFLLQTNAGAPNSKIIAVNINNPDLSKAEIIVPEKQESIKSAATGGGKLFVDYLKDVSTRTNVYDLKGKLLKEVKYPGIGNGGGLGGNKDDRFVFYAFTSFTVPPTIYKYDIATGLSTVFRKPEVSFNPADYETRQVFYTSKDGTKIPMFVINKKGIKLDGTNVTLLYAYGGFKINLEPAFSATLLPFLNAGGVYAQA
ncbi:MAG: S9 family peptidase, partial [Ferruginibacter sp.]